MTAFAIFISSANAQIKYKEVDESVEKFGTLADLNVARIADTITAAFSDREQKARAIYYWITHNIAIDPKAVKQNDTKNTLPERVIELRRGNAVGFSLLFQEMCSHVNIRCLTVDGYIRFSAAEINEKADEKNHSWNVVQLGQSPENWYYADAFRGSGFLDKKMTTFTKQFKGELFFANRILFNLASFPDNSAWQLGPGPKSLKEFAALPVIGTAAFSLGVRKLTPALGFIKGNLKKPVVFNIGISGADELKSITILAGDDKKALKPEEIEFSNDGASLRFSYQFKKEDSYPVKIMADGKELLQYMAEISE